MGEARKNLFEYLAWIRAKPFLITMAQDTQELRTKTRRVKNHILTRFLKLAERVDEGETLKGLDKEVYEQLMLTFARNVIPRSHEHGGDPENETPIPILTTNVSTYNGNSKDSQTSQKDTGGPRGNISQ